MISPKIEALAAQLSTGQPVYRAHAAKLRAINESSCVRPEDRSVIIAAVDAALDAATALRSFDWAGSDWEFPAVQLLEWLGPKEGFAGHIPGRG